MPSIFLVDLALGAIAFATSVWLQHEVRGQRLPRPDDEVVRADLTSALRWWGLAVLLLGLLALAQFPGGFTLPIWSVLGLGLGAIGLGMAALRWRMEGSTLGDRTTGGQSWVGESETWPYALIGWVVGLAATYVLGLLLNIMQPVHVGISLLESGVGYALGLVIWTPQTKLHRTPVAPAPEPDRHTAMTLHSSRPGGARRRRRAESREVRLRN